MVWFKMLQFECELDVNLLDENEKCLLHYAVEQDNIKSIETLLSFGANPNRRTSDNQTPLHLACHHNHTIILETLVAHNAEINPKDDAEETPLFIAARARNAAPLKYLISLGASLYSRNVVQETLLHVAAESGNEYFAGLLLDHGLDANARTACGDTPLELAIKHGRLSVVDLLLDHFKMTLDTDRAGNAVRLAVEHDQVEICEKLLGSLNLDIGSITCSMLLMHAAAWNDSSKMLKLLGRQKGIDIDQQDCDGYTALHIAAGRSGNGDSVEVLLALGSRQDLVTCNADLALHLAAGNGHEGAVRLLAKNEFFSWKNKMGLTPIDMARLQEWESLLPVFKQEKKGSRLKKRVSFSKYV